MNLYVLEEPRPMPVLADVDLVGQVIAGDHQAFRTLMQRHNQLLYRTVRSILKNEAEAEDAVQEAWVQAYRALHRRPPGVPHADAAAQPAALPPAGRK